MLRTGTGKTFLSLPYNFTYNSLKAIVSRITMLILALRINNAGSTVNNKNTYNGHVSPHSKNIQAIILVPNGELASRKPSG